MENSFLVKELIVDHLGVRCSEVTEQADLIADLGADSLSLASLVAALESQLDITISSDRLLDIGTVGDLIRLLQECDSRRNGTPVPAAVGSSVLAQPGWRGQRPS